MPATTSARVAAKAFNEDLVPESHKNRPLVCVQWVDAFNCDDTGEVEEALNPEPDQYLIYVAGWELRNDDEWLIIAHELYKEGRVRGWTAIPKSLVVKRTVLG